MEIIQDEEKKLVQVWLTRKESENPAVQKHIKPMYVQHIGFNQTQRVVVVHSDNVERQNRAHTKGVNNAARRSF